MMNTKWMMILLSIGCWTVVMAQEEILANPAEDNIESATEWTTDAPPVTTTTTRRRPTRIRISTSTSTSKVSTSSSTATQPDFKARILLTSPDGQQEEDLSASTVAPSSSTMLDNSLRTINNDWTPIVRPSTRLPLEPSVSPSSVGSTSDPSTSTRLLIRPTPLLRPLPTIVAAPGRIRPSSSTPSTNSLNSGISTIQPPRSSSNTPSPPLLVPFDIADAGVQPPNLFPDDAVFFPPQYVDDLNVTASTTIRQPLTINSTVTFVENVTTSLPNIATTTTTIEPQSTNSSVEVEDEDVVIQKDNNTILVLTNETTVEEPIVTLPNNRSENDTLVTDESLPDDIPAATDVSTTEEDQTTDPGMVAFENVTSTEATVSTTTTNRPRASILSTVRTNSPESVTTVDTPTSIPDSVSIEPISSPPPAETTSTTVKQFESGRTTTLSNLAGLSTLFPALVRQPSSTTSKQREQPEVTTTSTTTTTTTTMTTPIPLTTLLRTTISIRPPSSPIIPFFTSEDPPNTVQTSAAPHDVSTEFPPINDWASSSSEGSSSSSTQGPMDKTTIIAVSVSVSLILCLTLLLLVFLVIRRRRARAVQGTCQPARMDAYSLDNVSQSGSNNWQRSGKVRNSLRASKRSYLNQAFDDSAAFSVPLTAAQLALYMEKPITSIEAEFRNVATTSTVRLEELPAGVESKNRYANVLPIPETRVHIRMVDGQALETVEQYINANYVKGPKEEPHFYIACQGPMDETVEDFWQMMWENQVRTIVQLTDLSENGVARCAEYLPPSEVLDCHRLYGDYQVTLKSRELRDNYVTSHVQLKRMEDNLVREITHLWYSSWPATGVPEDPKTVAALLMEARKGQSKESGQTPPPIVVHCSPGTGRTGAVLSIDVCMRQLDSTRSIDIPRTVYRLRQDRAGCVQTAEQYAFIYKAVNFYACQLSNGALDSL